ncbi:MAG: endolytic transglycosylase MltG [Desulfovibrionaceae bacterium]|nr:endolytic transglycosylase MltG [Desulfovibrionaceae bacterium]
MSLANRPILRALLVFLLVLGLCALGAAGWVGYTAYQFLHVPPEKPGENVEIVIYPNTSVRELSGQLVEKHAVTNADYFQLLVRAKKAGKRFKSGRYLVHTGWTPERVLSQLISGKPYLERITLPEGLTWWEIGKRLEEKGYVRFEDFQAVIHDPENLRYWGIPFDSAEGFLYPDTYRIMRPLELNAASAKSIASRLIDTFWRKTAHLWPEGKRPGPKDAETVRRLVTLASIVEKETSVPEERARVAGVYANRIQKGMLLQADPTIIYGIGPSFKPPILRSQLENAANPYNTYKNPGLPPGPICSPGIRCLEAAAAPERHDYIFFVANGNGGGHTFSTTLEEHNRAVQVYRALQR